MATINEITTGSSYTGNAALGGYTSNAIDIDTKPLVAMIGYTVMYNKAQYDQRQVDNEKKINELAEIAQLDIANTRGKHKDEIVLAVAEMEAYAREYAMKGVPKTPQQRIEQELEFRQKTDGLKRKIKTINAKELTYQTRLNAIKTNVTDAKEKAIRIEKLKKEFDNSSWDTPLAAEEAYDIKIPTIGAPAMISNTTSIDAGNEILQVKTEYFSWAKSMDNSTAEYLGFTNQQPPAGASDSEITQWRLTQAKGGEMKAITDAATFLNSALASYKDPTTGVIDQEAVQADNAVAASFLNIADRYNEYAAKKRADIKKGYHETKVGRVKIAESLTEKDYPVLDKNKPFSPEQLITLQKFANAAPDKKDETIVITNNLSDAKKLDLGWYEAQTARINALKPAASASSGSTAAGSLTNQAALLFAEHVNNIKKRSAGTNETVIVASKGVDPITKRALGLGEGSFVAYRPDGTAMVGANEDGTGGTPMTIEQQKFNFIAAVKGGSKEEAVMDDKFIVGQEEGFRSLPIFGGATDARTIWDNWGPNQNRTTTPTQSGSTNKVMSDAEYQAYLKSKGL